jgi:hypothetical protein
MSTRAIAPIVGVHRDTVAEDIRGGGIPPRASALTDTPGKVTRITGTTPEPEPESYWSPDAVMIHFTNN